jgi:hypothetical protein
MKRMVKWLTSLARIRRILLQFRRIPRRHWKRPGNAGEELLSGAGDRARDRARSGYRAARSGYRAARSGYRAARAGDRARAPDRDRDLGEAEETEHWPRQYTCTDSYY